jgi:hypothetical protein
MSAPLPLTSVFFSSCGPHPSHSGENVIVEAQHTPYVEPSSKHLNLGLNPSQSLTPVSIGVTDHHYLVLRPGQLQMLSSLSGERCGFVHLRALDCGSVKYFPQQKCSGCAHFFHQCLVWLFLPCVECSACIVLLFARGVVLDVS